LAILGHLGKRRSRSGPSFFSADLFAPNVAKHGAAGRLDDAMALDAAATKSVLDFILTKRHERDIALLFDGRSRRCRRAFEEKEEQFAATGAYAVHEIWVVCAMPAKTEYPRSPQRLSNFAAQNREVCMCVTPKLRSGDGGRSILGKVRSRSEFNVCGESSTAATSYSAVPLRRLCELPRMDHGTKCAIVGASAAGELPWKQQRLRDDIGEFGHPFSFCEGKPIQFWQQIVDHFGVTHVVDFSPGSGALAIAASGAVEYEGVAITDGHRDWLDGILDRCSLYMGAKNEAYLEAIGADAAIMEKFKHYFSGVVMEARRYFEPIDQRDGDGDDGSGGSASDGPEDDE
jgi:hypothetical protein